MRARRRCRHRLSRKRASRPAMSKRVHERGAEEDAVEAVIEGTEGGTIHADALLAAASNAAEAEVAVSPARERLDGIVESLLFAAGTPLALRRLVDVLDGPSAKDVKAAIERLMAEYNRPDRGFHLLAVAGGFQFRSAPAYSDWVRADRKSTRL